MKAARGLISYTIMVVTIIFLVLSFADFYNVTIIGSALDNVTGDLIRTTEESRNSIFSVICAAFPLMNFVILRRWTRISAIIFSVINLLFITRIYPTFVFAMSTIGKTYSITLTSIGRIGAIIVLLTIFLLFFEGIHLRKMQKGEEKGSNEG